MGQPKEFEMPGKGKILMGKGPVKRPTPVKPKPDGAKKRALPMPKPKPGEPAPKGEKQQRSIFDTPKRNPRNPIGGAGSIKRKPVMPPKKGGR
jgi:hypothetical protein